MGIILSAFKYSNNEIADEENTVLFRERLNPRSDVVISNRWQQNGGYSNHLPSTEEKTPPRQLTASVANLGVAPSFKYTSSEHNVEPSVISIEGRNTWILDSGEENGGGKQNQVKIRCSCRVLASEPIWIKHYSSSQRILVVGEGDFSFSTCLATAFGSASNMIATSLDSQEFLLKNYQQAQSNLWKLGIKNCGLMHGIDATKMCYHDPLGHVKFDRIVFNFPFAGLFKTLPRDSQLRKYRSLVSLFLKNAKEMLNEDGEIHISHKTNGFYNDWKVVPIASSHKLRLIEAIDFDLGDYPGYNPKRGFGDDENIKSCPSLTYKFGLK